VQLALRPYTTAGVALVGAGLIAITPLAPQQPAMYAAQAIKLVSGEDALPDVASPWTDVFDTASQNATTLWDNFALAPGVALQQAAVNQSDLWQQFVNDPTSSTLSSVMQEFQTNLDNVLTGLGLQGSTIGNFDETFGWPQDSIASLVLQHTMIGNHALMFGEIFGYLPASEQSLLEPIINWLGSPESAVLMGSVGPLISPLVELYNCISAGDDLNTTLADVTGAFFNGADLNLDSLLPTINSLIGSEFPPGMTMAELDIAFGGLLSTGSAQVADYTSGGTEIPAVGGSLFNSVGLEFTGVPQLGSLTLTSEPIGPIAAWETLSQTVSGLLGSGWSDSTATVGAGLSALGGNASPPISLDVTAPIASLLNDMFSDSASSTGTAAATDLSTLIQDFASLF
jgi:hypothetical protein